MPLFVKCRDDTSKMYRKKNASLDMEASTSFHIWYPNISKYLCNTILLFILFFFFPFILNLSYQNHNKWWYFIFFSYGFNLIMNLTFCLVKIFNFLIKRKYIFHKKMYLTFYINFIKKIGTSLRKIGTFIPKRTRTLYLLS